MIGSLLENLDEDMAEQLLDQLDDDAINSALRTGIDDYVVPELRSVQQAATEEYPDNETVAQEYESYSEERQDEVFHRTVADLIAVFAELRSEPSKGAAKLKDRLRSPYVVEGLLLIFDHPDTPDEVVDVQKEFARTQIKYLGANLLPELYTDDELEEIVDELFTDAAVEEALEMVDDFEGARPKD